MLWSKADSAAENKRIFEEEQSDVFTLQRQIALWRKHASARRAEGDMTGARLRDRLADNMSDALSELDILCGENAFRKKNAQSVTIHKIDLHCLLPHQALRQLEIELTAVQGLGGSRLETELHIVTGHGAHSKSGTSAVRSAVTEYLDKVKKSYQISDTNKGLIVVPVCDDEWDEWDNVYDCEDAVPETLGFS